MSIISEQVKKLRYKADIYNTVGSAWELNRAEAKILQGLLRKAADTIETLSAKLAANSGWIPCSERLPEEKGWYLVYAKNQRPFVAYFKGKTFPLNNHYHEIVAWMTLPEPYEEKENG